MEEIKQQFSEINWVSKGIDVLAFTLLLVAAHQMTKPQSGKKS